MDTTVDHSLYDAEVRVANVWFTPSLRAQIVAEAPTGSPGATYIAWTAHRAHTVATAQAESDAGAPVDTPTTADRSYLIMVTAHGHDGWVSGPEQHVMFLTLSRATASTGWQIAMVEETS